MTPTICPRCKTAMRGAEVNGIKGLGCICGAFIQPNGTADKKSVVAAMWEQPVTLAPGHTMKLPYPLSTNNLFASVNGRRILSADGREYHRQVGTIARLHFPMPIEGKVSVHMDYWPLRGVGMDLDNIAKCCLDGMKGICWLDDKQIWRLSIHRHNSVPGGDLEVRIEEIKGEPE